MAIKKISEFTLGTPTISDKILFEQSGAGKSATIENLGKAIGINLDLLWTNGSPTSAFASQTIILDVSKYKYFLITVRTSINSNNNTFCNLVIKGITNRIVGVDSLGVSVRPQVTVPSNGIYFSDGYATNSETLNNNYAIPYQIYGVK